MKPERRKSAGQVPNKEVKILQANNLDRSDGVVVWLVINFEVSWGDFVVYLSGSGRTLFTNIHDVRRGMDARTGIELGCKHILYLLKIDYVIFSVPKLTSDLLYSTYL